MADLFLVLQLAVRSASALAVASRLLVSSVMALACSVNFFCRSASRLGLFRHGFDGLDARR